MNNIFKALIAGYGAKKLGGGCFGTILVFVIIWVLLGQCGAAPAWSAATGEVDCRINYRESYDDLLEPTEIATPWLEEYTCIGEKYLQAADGQRSYYP